LDEFIAKPVDAARQWIGTVFDFAFHSRDPQVTRHVRDRLGQIQTLLGDHLTYECHTESDRECKVAAAFASRGSKEIGLCPGFFYGSDEWQAEAIVHEVAHTLLGGQFITDRGYHSDRVYPLLNTPEALTNAESYAIFVEKLVKHDTSIVTRIDSSTDCPNEWQEPIKQSVARAERWNRDAQVIVNNRDSAFLKGWANLQKLFLGSTKSKDLDAAQAVFDATANSMRSRLSFVCHTTDDARCSIAGSFWANGAVHLCPVWKNFVFDEQRIVSILTAIYHGVGGIDETTSDKYAHLAWMLHDKYFAVPTLPEVLGQKKTP
jgi:hypothetical protein